MKLLSRWTVAVALLLGIGVGAGRVHAATNQELADQVRRSEQAFAKTMADRKFDAFGEFVSKEGLFFGGKLHRGRDEVTAAWKQFFDGPAAPFSWEPETVEVLDSGTLALSSGPVHDPTGKLIGRFNSVWRLESDGRWRVIFDKGCDVCEPAPEPAKKP